ncbi:hypothetical protein OSTOST_15210 [Ostertagia ostertagi]
MLILSLLCIVGVVTSSTECIWAVGKLVCLKNQTRVLDSVVEVWDKDGPQSIKLIDILDPDDKAGLTMVDDERMEYSKLCCRFRLVGTDLFESARVLFQDQT